MVDSENGSARFNPTNTLLMSEFEQDTTLVRINKRKACVDVLVDWLAALPNLDQNKKYKTSIAFSSGRFLLTGEGCKPSVGHNNIEILRNASPGYFFLPNGSEFGKMYACKGTLEFIFFPDSEEQKLASILKMDAILLPPFSVFVGHEFLHHSTQKFS